MGFDFQNLEHLLNDDIRSNSQRFRGVILSCSGHLDSTVVLEIFCRKIKFCDLPIFAVLHFNFGLRDLDSDEDEAFVRAIAARYGVGFFNFRPRMNDPLANGRGIQEWARTERMRIYRKLVGMGFVVALGHHLDDQAETTLFRLARGTSAKRALGMSRLKSGMWRPLLHLSKDQISAIARELNISHRYDRSNDTIEYSRNKIRNQVLPVLKVVNPAAVSNIANWAKRTSELIDYLESSIRASMIQIDARTISIPQRWFDHQPANRSIAFLALELIFDRVAIDHNSYTNFYEAICDQIRTAIKNQSDKTHRFDDMLEFRLDSGRLNFANMALEPKFQKLERFAQCRNEIMTQNVELIGQNAHLRFEISATGQKLIEIEANQSDVRQIKLKIP